MGILDYLSANNSDTIEIDNTSSKALDNFIQFIMNSNNLKGANETSDFLKDNGITLKDTIDKEHKKYDLLNMKELFEFIKVLKNTFINQYMNLAKKYKYLYMCELIRNLPDFFETYIYPVVISQEFFSCRILLSSISLILFFLNLS